MSRILWCSCIVVGILSFCIPVFSVHAGRSVSISASAPSIFGDDTIILTASHSGFIDGETIYIKGAFFQPGSSNYFGYSKKLDGSWIKNGITSIEQPAVVIGSWDNQLAVKSDFSDSGYVGEGEYGLKLGYYYTTTALTLSSINWSTNSVIIAISAPDPTATQIPTPTPVVPTHTLTPTETRIYLPTSTSIPLPTIVPTRPVVLRIAPTLRSTSDILGIDNSATKSAQNQEATRAGTIKNVSIHQRKEPVFVFALLCIGVGVAILSCGLALEQTRVWNKNHQLKKEKISLGS